MAGIYLYYKKSYLPRQQQIAIEEKAKQDIARKKIQESTPEKKPVEPEVVKAPEIKTTPDPDKPDVKIEVPKARVITTGNQTIKSSIYKKPEKEKTPEEIAREKELAAIRKKLRDAQNLANTEKISKNKI